MENDIVQALLNQALRDGPSKLMSNAAHEIFSLRLEASYYKGQTDSMRRQAHEAYEFVRDGLCNDGLSKLLEMIGSETPNAALTGAEGVRVEGTVMQQEDTNETLG